MKKIFSIFASSVLALSMFVSCSGDLHNDMDPAKVALIMGETKTILDDAGIIGSINDWKNKDGVKDQGDALTKVDDTTYTYTFTAEEETEQFSIQEDREAKWSKPRWCGALKKDEDNAVKIEPKGEAAMIYSTDPDPSHFKLTKLKVGTAYKITITIVDEDKKSLKASVNVDGDAPAADTPAPYYFDGLYLVGGCFNTSANSGDDETWTFYTSNLIHGASKDVKTGNVTYTVDIKATAASGEMGINDSSWGNKLNGTGVTVAANATTATELNGTEGNFNVTGLTVGSAYRVEITTTPQKVVTVKIYEIAEITLSVKITNLTEGDSAWINGNIWGSDWPMGWPIAEWNENDAAKTAGYISAHAAAVADDAGNAVFKSAWNATVIAKPGDTLNWEFKVVYINEGDGWDDDGAVKDCGANITFDYDVTTGGAKTLVIDASDWSVTVE